MVKRHVVWTRTADLQLVGVLEYWVNRNKSTSFSKKLLALISQRTSQISKNPLLFRSTIIENIRSAPIGNFSLYYRFTEDQITVLAFWDNRQDPEKLLEILKSK